MLLPTINAFSADTIEGEIKASGKIVDVTGNGAKFNEYRDITDGIYGSARLKYDGDVYFFNLKAVDIGYATQKYSIDGGMWGKFKYNIQYNEVPHNFTYGARTFYSGAGTGSLDFSGATAPVPGTLTANTNYLDTAFVLSQFTNIFDYSTTRRQTSGGLRFDMMKPLYVDISLERELKQGTMPVSAARGSSPGQGNVELPSPLDYTTNTVKAEVGYSKNPVFASLSYSYTKFSNSIENLYFRFPNTSAQSNTLPMDVYTLPPDNQYHKLAFKGKVKLPMNSALSVNAGYSSATTQVSLFDSYIYALTTASAVGQGAVGNVTGLTDTLFNGRVNTTNFSAVLTSNPASNIDGKMFFKYNKKENKSDEISGTASSNGLLYTNHLFGYDKNAFGLEANLKLPARFTVKPYYNYAKVDRLRRDIPRTTDNIYGLEFKWKGIEFMTAKAVYERMNRGATWANPITEVVPTPSTGTNYTADTAIGYSIPFDGAPQNRDTYKIALDIYPDDNLNVGLGYKNKNSRYKDTTLGLLYEKSNVFSVSADYTIGKSALLSGYVDTETAKQSQSGSRSGTNTNTVAPATDNAYSEAWNVKQKDISFDYGLSADLYVIPNTLALRAQYDDVRSDGSADLTYYTVTLPSGYNNDLVDIGNWGDYRKKALMLKATYSVSKNVSLSIGYAHENYKNTDTAANGYYYYFVTSTATPTTSTGVPVNVNGSSYLTGAYSKPSYTANVVFCAVTHKF